MPEYDSKYLNNYLNGITYENAFWKIRYNELWHRFLYIQNENNRLYSLLNECYMGTTETTETTETAETAETAETTENIQNRKILSHLQNKNNELMKNVMDKSKEIFMLQEELKKHTLKT